MESGEALCWEGQSIMKRNEFDVFSWLLGEGEMSKSTGDVKLVLIPWILS